MGEAEFMIRGLGYVRRLEHLELVAIGVNEKTGTPVYLRDVARAALGPLTRRGLTEVKGEVVPDVVRDALRSERAEGDRRREAQAGETPGRSASRREDHHRLRSLRPRKEVRDAGCALGN